MKTWKLAAICAAFTLAAVAAQMSGDYNSWLGYLAGMNADGNRSTMQGAGAGGESSSIVRTDFIGAAAGAFSTNLEDCVGIGYRALRNSSNMNNVVAIGTGALTNRSGLVKATWINGQLFASAQGNTFWIKANPDTPNTNAPIYYADGILNLNAATIRFNGEATAGGGGGESGPVVIGYDLYVDPANGDDIYAGTSPGTAKRTIDAAYSLVTTNDMRICLLSGVHASPTGAFTSKNDYPAYRVKFIAPYGPDKTIIDGEGERCFKGCQDAFMTISGCTLRNFTVRYLNRCAFFAVAFTNCVFTGDIFQASEEKGMIFEYCIFEDCRANVTRTFGTDGESSSLFSSFFIGCDAYDSVFVIAHTNAPKTFAAESYFKDCFIWTDSVKRFAIDGTTAAGTSAAFDDCTVICPSAAQEFETPVRGCLLGINETNSIPAWGGTDTILTNAATVEAVIGSDYRPSVTNWFYRYNGYKSGSERATRNSMLESIRAALEAAAGN